MFRLNGSVGFVGEFIQQNEVSYHVTKLHSDAGYILEFKEEKYVRMIRCPNADRVGLPENWTSEMSG